ncbi:MAG: UDP-3-O-[3-hydroxymyristoyl] N-acetylglucosamine deacetylase [Rhodospirillaceae bacterium]|nr:UDP-3-O-[3-hydroxymyristoyl] N-acetylglucosamine deacetylase [Rhodospirillaceae bacterium]
MTLNISSSSTQKSTTNYRRINKENAGAPFQCTLSSSISCSGIGLHSGVPVAMSLHPAPVDTGIAFKRVDIIGGGAIIPARWDHIADSRMCTVLATENGISVATVEHLMAALYGMGIDNALIELKGPEVPAMDGSAAPFIFLIECAGLKQQAVRRKSLRILKPIVYKNGSKEVSLSPSHGGLQVEFDINFTASAIGRQRCRFSIDTDIFKMEISKARTFGFLSDVTALREAGLARGGSLDNAIVVDGDRVLNDDGLRHKDEFVRHKALDAVGDLYLTGHHIIGCFRGNCSSHADTANLLRLLFSQKESWDLVEESDQYLASVRSNATQKLPQTASA